MKIMLISTIRGNNSTEWHAAIDTIVSSLQHDGHDVWHEHLTGCSQVQLDSLGEVEHEQFHNVILRKIKESDIVVGETSQQSFSVGYLLAYAVAVGKPTVMMYKKSCQKANLVSSLSQSEKLMVETYEGLRDLQKTVSISVAIASEKIDIRFNFFITPAINTYLNWVAKEKKIPRSVYLRRLIEQDMQANPDYSKDE